MLTNLGGCKPNEGIEFFAKTFGSYYGYNRENNSLPKVWSCPCYGHAKILVGLVGAQTKCTHICNIYLGHPIEI
jgi:hypothetical protein